MNSLNQLAIHSIAINNIGLFYPIAGSKFVFLLPQKPPPTRRGQTCLLRPMVAKGKVGRRNKELTDGSDSENKR